MSSLKTFVSVNSFVIYVARQGQNFSPKRKQRALTRAPPSQPRAFDHRARRHTRAVASMVRSGFARSRTRRVARIFARAPTPIGARDLLHTSKMDLRANDRRNDDDGD